LPVLAAVIVAGGWTGIAPAVTVAGLVALTQYGSDISAAALLARKRTDLAAAALAADRVLMLVCVAAALALQRSVLSAYAGMLAANLLRLTASLAMARRTVLTSARPGWNAAVAADFLRRGTPVALSLIAFA